MATKNTKNTKKSTKSNVWCKDRNDEFNNYVLLWGKIKNIFVDTDKVTKFSLEVPHETQNGKIAYSWVTCVTFDDVDLNVDDVVSIEGIVTTNHYNDKWTTEITCNSIECE